jgi:hypothetical protein
MSKDTPTFQTKAVVTPYHPGMTLRQYAAIKLKVPDSGIPELDAMIVQSRRDELAGTVVAGVLASLQEGDDFPVAGCDWAYKVANALLKAGEAK